MRSIAGALLLAAMGCGTERQADDTGAKGGEERVEIGAPVPAYRAVTLEGDSVSLSALRGKVVLLNVWATWCHPCRDEIPELQRLYERHRAGGLEIIGVSVDAGNEGEGIRDFMREFRMTYPVWHDPDERVSARFLVVGVPATFLIDRSGILRWRMTGPIQVNDPGLARALQQALGA